MKAVFVFLLMLAVCAPLCAGDELPKATAEAPTAQQLSEELIYSVDRVPERTFDTSRAVQVITVSELWRKSGMSLASVLEHEAGISIINYDAPGGVPLVRGLHGKQVMVLIDGVKVNNAIWRNASRDYLGIIDLSQVERIEIVRGVVSVLGTESLGGVVNLITKKGPPGKESFGGTIGTRYGTAEHAFRTPIEVYGQNDSVRWIAGGNYFNSGDMHAGGAIGTQDNTSYDTTAFHASMQYLLSPEKTISAGFQSASEEDFSRAWQLAQGTNLVYEDGPSRFNLGSISYQDLTDHGFADSLRATGYFNRQHDARSEIRVATPNTENGASEIDNMRGLNLELGKFIGKHHVLYGVDVTGEKIDSKAHDLNLLTDVATDVRGRYTNGAEYRTMGVYVQDRFDIGRWLTTTAGVRYGRFQSSGSENSSLGVISIDSRKSDFTGALNFVFHPTERLNLIVNGMRGFRAPNIDDLSRFSVRSQGIDVPNPSAGPEHVDSYEMGMKYENGRLGGSAFYYRNSFTQLLVRAPGLFKGLPYLDSNGNGKQDAKEPPIFQLLNVGTARITGYEASVHYSPVIWMNVTGNLTKTVGTDTLADQPLDRIPPVYGNVAVTFFGSSARRLWGEFLFDFAGAQRRLSPSDITDYRIGPGGTDGYKVFGVRGGTTIAERIRLLVGIDNLTNKAYKSHDSWVYRPGRQLVLGTQYRF